MRDRIMVSMGGRAAEEILFGEDNITTGASGDIESATRQAREMVTRLGFSEKVGFMALGVRRSGYLSSEFSMNCSEKLEYEADMAVAELLQACYEDTKKLLQDNEELLVEMAFEVYRNMEMSGERLRKIFDEKMKKNG
jgi:cell division protease FtsH